LIIYVMLGFVCMSMGMVLRVWTIKDAFGL